MQFRLKKKNGNSVLMTQEEVGGIVAWQGVFWLYSLISYAAVPFSIAASLLPSWENSDSEVIFKGLLACAVSGLIVFMCRQLKGLIFLKMYAALGSTMFLWSIFGNPDKLQIDSLASFLLSVNVENIFHAIDWMAIMWDQSGDQWGGFLAAIFFSTFLPAFASYRFAAFTQAEFFADEFS